MKGHPALEHSYEEMENWKQKQLPGTQQMSRAVSTYSWAVPASIAFGVSSASAASFPLTISESGTITR
jgi:hypothetical protein